MGLSVGMEQPPLSLVVVWTKDAAVAAAYRVDVQRWSGLFDELMDVVGSCFGRPEPRRWGGTSWPGCLCRCRRRTVTRSRGSSRI